MSGIKQWGPLTAYLILMLSSAAGSMLYDVYAAATYSSSHHLYIHMHKYPRWADYAFAGIAALRFVSVLAVWYWSKSGVVAFMGAVFLCIGLDLYLRFGLGVFQLVHILLIYALTRHDWPYMSWDFSAVQGRRRVRRSH